MRFILFLFLLSFHSFHGQNELAKDYSRNHSIALLSSVERNDIFMSLSYLHTGKLFSFSPSLGFGLIHSAFQNNPLARIGGSAHYNWLNKEFKNEKGIGYYYSFYKKPVYTNFYDLKLGYMLRYGNRFKLVHSASLGWLTERFNGNTRTVVLNYTNFALTIGIAYEI